MSFSIEQYLGLVGRLDDADIDYESFRSSSLDDETLRCLRYMHDVEFHTTCYLRDLLVTSAHDDPEITAFLAMWSYEEFWHGEAIAKVLAAHDEPHGAERIKATRRRVGRERLTTLSMMALSGITEHVTTIALTWGAVNEWTTQAGYIRLAAQADHPVLSDLLRRIAKQEGRHIDFYMTHAKARLEVSSTARRLTRFALRSKWRPVGAGVMPDEELAFMVGHLFGGPDGETMATRIDARIGRLPGLADLGLARNACQAA